MGQRTAGKAAQGLVAAGLQPCQAPGRPHGLQLRLGGRPLLQWGRMGARHLGLAKLLLIATALYNVAESVIAIWSGVAAGSLALIAFGADSSLGVAAASAVLWRISTADEELGERREQRAMRLIGWTFLALAAAVLYQALAAMAGREGADGGLGGLR